MRLFVCVLMSAKRSGRGIRRNQQGYGTCLVQGHEKATLLGGVGLSVLLFLLTLVL